VLEVGSNDGTLLEALTTHGMRAIGVEPSQQLAEISKEKCEAVYTNFLDGELSDFLVKSTVILILWWETMYLHT